MIKCPTHLRPSLNTSVVQMLLHSTYNTIHAGNTARGYLPIRSAMLIKRCENMDSCMVSNSTPIPLGDDW